MVFSVKTEILECIPEKSEAALSKSKPVSVMDEKKSESESQSEESHSLSSSSPDFSL